MMDFEMKHETMKMHRKRKEKTRQRQRTKKNINNFFYSTTNNFNNKREYNMHKTKLRAIVRKVRMCVYVC